MADCGTSGSAIDQAARFFSGTATTTTTAASNHLNRNTNYAQLLEHTTSALISQSFGPQQSQQQQQQRQQQQHRSTFFSLTPTAADSAIGSIPEFVPAPPLLVQQQLQQVTTHPSIIVEDPANSSINSSTSAIAVREKQLQSQMSTTSLPIIHNSYHPQQQQQQHQLLLQPQYHQYHTFQQQQQQQLMMMQSQNQQLLLRQQQINLMLQHRQQQEKQHQQQANERNTIDTINPEENQQQQQGHDGIVQPATIQELSSAWRDALQQLQQDVTTTADDVTTVHQNYDSHDIDPLNHTDIGATFNDLASAWAEAQLELQNELNNVIANDDNNMWSGDYNENGNKYQFTSTYTTTTVQEPQQQQQNGNDILTTNYMEEGYREFNAGNIKNAIHLFEMELQQIDIDNATAWCMLGKCHAENDMDTLAIQCFEEAVVRDPYNIEALLALGVSYVNELNHVAALKNLKEYILNNPKFADLDVSGDTDIYSTSKNGDGFYPTSTDAAFDDVQRLLLSALDYQMQHNRDDHITTASVLEALGVVYNVSRDYDAAIDVLQQGCALRPDDYTLWNKLGATLANSGEHRSEEALLAYHQALKIKPKYARAWLNMAIAHSNVQQYHDAARCYLQTLSINPNAVHCWSFLRIALSCLEMHSLIPATASQNIEVFRGHFDFTSYTDSLDNPTVLE